MQDLPQKKDDLNASEKTEQFLRLLAVNQNRIYAFILTLVPSLSDADDLLQDTVSVMWRKFNQFEPGSHFVSWGIKIAHLEIMSFRKRCRKRTFDSQVETAIHHCALAKNPEVDHRISALRYCLGKLDAHGRELIRMRYEENITQKNLAKRIGISVQTMCKRMSKIHDLLFRCVRRTIASEEMA